MFFGSENSWFFSADQIKVKIQRVHNILWRASVVRFCFFTAPRLPATVHTSGWGNQESITSREMDERRPSEILRPLPDQGDGTRPGGQPSYTGERTSGNFAY